MFSNECMCAFRSWPMATKLTPFLGNTFGVKDVGFQENPSNGKRYTAVKLLCVPCRVPLIIGHCNRAHSVCRHCTHCDRCGVPAKSLERKPRYFCENIVYYNKVPFIFGPSYPNRYNL